MRALKKTYCLAMLEDLTTLFASTAFWREFTQERLYARDGTMHAVYRRNKWGQRICLRFCEFEGLVKSFSLVVDRRTVVANMFFLTVEELTLFLNRTGEILSVNFSRTDSEQLKALFYASKRTN